MARELRDRWLEQVNDGQAALPSGKHEVSRQRTGSEPTVRAIAA